jgi:hypothetical protein
MSVARSGPKHRLQWLHHFLSRPAQVERYYTLLAPERLSPSTRDRVRTKSPSRSARFARHFAAFGEELAQSQLRFPGYATASLLS